MDLYPLYHQTSCDDEKADHWRKISPIFVSGYAGNVNSFLERHLLIKKDTKMLSKLFRCPKLHGYAIATFGVRVELKW